jgi:hypothetical protein
MQILLGEELFVSARLCRRIGVLRGEGKVSLARRESSSRKERNRSAEENLLPSAERKKLRAHAGKFLCAQKYFFVRTQFERFI